MIRIFIYLLIILSLGFGFAWIADHPGVVTLNWQGRDIRTSLMVTVVALALIVATLLFVWGILRGVIGFPSLLSRFLNNRRRDRGYKALSQGLIAAGTGDKVLARRLAKESGKLLTNEPLVDLLDAQTCLLEGNHNSARGRFQAMLENEDTKLLGLRGLYLEAEREGAHDATRQYAEQAVQIAPSLAWAGNAKLQNQTRDGDWEAALGTLESNRAAGLLDKAIAKRHRAVLLTARAIAEEPANPDLATKLATEAHRLASGLVPAAVIGATALVRGNNLRKASKLIEATWKIKPHPELAQSYVHLRMGDAASDRLQRAKTLAKLHANHPEGNMAIALAAIDAREWAVARDAMKPVLVNDLTERACLIMADLEEGEHGDAGRMRDWLSRAVRAPRDAKWTAEGYTSHIWLPVSPKTGEIDVFVWKVPIEQLQEPAQTLDIGDLAEPLNISHVQESRAGGSDGDGFDNLQTGFQPDKAVAAGVVGAISDVVVSKVGDQEEPEQAQGETSNDVEDATIVDLVTPQNESQSEQQAQSNTENNGVPGNNGGSNDAEEPSQTIFPLKRRPDDPGVEDKGDNAENRFKLF